MAQVREPYRLAADTLGPAEIEAAKIVLDSGRLTMSGRVREFEAAFAEWVGAKHAVMVNSGSSANLLLVDALFRSRAAGRLKPGDEVIVPGLSWPTTVWPVAQLGAVPVFVDVDRETLGLDLDAARSAISPRTRALFVIHPLGRALDLEAYAAFAAEHGLYLIEDCCESLGAHWEGAHVGTAGLGGTFSFYFSHHISTIEGGMLVTDDEHLADDLRSARAHGWIRDRSDRQEWASRHPELDERFLFATLGYNVRPTELQAAIGLIQLSRLDEMLSAREQLACMVEEWTEDLPWMRLIGVDQSGMASGRTRAARAHSWMTLPFRVLPEAPLSRNEVMRHLESQGVETRPVIAGNLARHPAVRSVAHRVSGSLDACDELLDSSFMIGCHPVLSPGALETLRAGLQSLALG